MASEPSPGQEAHYGSGIKEGREGAGLEMWPGARRVRRVTNYEKLMALQTNPRMSHIW